MTISTIRTGYYGLAVAVSVAAMLLFSPALAQDDANASPHWSKTSCQACHVESAPADGVVNLKAADTEAMCESCHGGRGTAVSCRHASGMPAGNMTIPETLVPALRNGQVVCSTCHDVVYQCKHPLPHYGLQNPGFLRDRTSRKSHDYCYKCHDTSGFEKFNPHTEVAGSTSRPTCELCHSGIPQTGSQGQHAVAFNMEQDLNETCQGCHVSRPHPRSMTFGGAQEEEWVHFVVPPEEVRERMLKIKGETGIDLPLDPISGKVFCATCHDPHEFEGGPVAAQPKHRLRADDICQVCHEK